MSCVNGYIAEYIMGFVKWSMNRFGEFLNMDTLHSFLNYAFAKATVRGVLCQN